jgi:hypothetical protein
MICTTPPVASSDIGEPSADEAAVWVTAIVRDVFVEVEAGTTLTVLTTPFPMAVAFIPKTIQVSVPIPGLQDTDFTASEPACPIATFTALKSAALYANVNCKLAGFSSGAGLLSVRSSVTVEPIAPDPDAKLRAGFCAKDWTLQKSKNVKWTQTVFRKQGKQRVPTTRDIDQIFLGR